MFGNKKFMGLRGSALQLAVSLVAGCDFLLFGYDQGVTGGLLTLPSFIKVFPQLDTSSSSLTAGEKSYNSTIQGTTVAIYNIGCFFGALVCMMVGQKLGRRRTLMCGATVMIIGAILQCSSYSLAQFIIGRVVTGLGNGFNTATVPVWQSECSKAHKRGQMVMVEGSLIAGGICLSYWIDYGFSFLEPSPVSWRFPIAFQIVFAIIILIFIIPLPESPRWLASRGRDAEASEILAALLGEAEDDFIVQTEMKEIKAAVEVAQSTSYRELFTMDENRHAHRTILAFVVQAFQQISGINLITYYASTIYENYVGLDSNLSRILAAANGTEYFIASWFAIFIIERVGRRKLMLIGAAGMSLSMMVLAICTSRVERSTDQAAAIVDAVFLFVFNSFFALGWLGMTWLYPAEITPLSIRAKANSISTSANWIFNFLVVMITPICFDQISYQTYIIFAVINAFIFPCVWIFFPETTTRSLEEMDAIFRKSKSVFDTVRIAREEPRRHDHNGNPILRMEEGGSSDDDEVATKREMSKEEYVRHDEVAETKVYD